MQCHEHCRVFGFGISSIIFYTMYLYTSLDFHTWKNGLLLKGFFGGYKQYTAWSSHHVWWCCQWTFCLLYCTTTAKHISCNNARWMSWEKRMNNKEEKRRLLTIIIIIIPNSGTLTCPGSKAVDKQATHDGWLTNSNKTLLYTLLISLSFTKMLAN